MLGAKFFNNLTVSHLLDSAKCNASGKKRYQRISHTQQRFLCCTYFYQWDTILHKNILTLLIVLCSFFFLCVVHCFSYSLPMSYLIIGFAVVGFSIVATMIERFNVFVCFCRIIFSLVSNTRMASYSFKNWNFCSI